MPVKEVYNYIDSFAPFCAQERWDNSGILVENNSTEIKSIMLCLDITKEIAYEAVRKNVSLVISHHPVIFSPLKTLTSGNPAVILSAGGVSAICMHTSFDLAKDGLNDFLAKKLSIGKAADGSIDDETGLGRIIELSEEISAKELAEIIKEKLCCKAVRLNLPETQIKRVGVISGSGAEYYPVAIKKGCDALITGDVKHNQFIDAQNDGFSIIDAGHYYTENIITEYLLEKLRGFADDVFIAESNRDITEII